MKSITRQNQQVNTSITQHCVDLANDNHVERIIPDDAKLLQLAESTDKHESIYISQKTHAKFARHVICPVPPMSTESLPEPLLKHISVILYPLFCTLHYRHLAGRQMPFLLDRLSQEKTQP